MLSQSTRSSTLAPASAPVALPIQHTVSGTQLPPPEPLEGTRLDGETGGDPNIAFTLLAPAGPAYPLVVVLVHGAGHTSACWQWVAARLVHSGHRVMLLDLPGHGLSSGHGDAGVRPDTPGAPHEQFLRVEGYQLADYAEALIRACRQAGIGTRQAVLVGHSMGGAVAQYSASRVPFAGVLSLAMPSWRRLPAMNNRLALRHPRAIVRVARQPESLVTDPFFTACFFLGFRDDSRQRHPCSPAAYAWLQAHLQPESSGFFADMRRGGRIHRRIRDGLQQTPLHFVAPAQDALCSPRAVLASRRDHPLATAATLANLPHNAMMPSRPDAPWWTVAQEIERFAIRVTDSPLPVELL